MQKETNGVPADSAKATGTTAGVASTGIAAGMTTSSGTAKTAGKAAAVATTGAATGPAATGVAPDPMPDEEMLYDLADLDSSYNPLLGGQNMWKCAKSLNIKNSPNGNIIYTTDAYEV